MTDIEEYTIGGVDDPALSPINRDALPMLEGSPKQIAWALDIREKWMEDIETLQRDYKNGIDTLNRYKITNPEKYQKQKADREQLTENRRKSIAAAKVAIASTASAKVIIGARNAFDDIVYDVADAMDNHKSDNDINRSILNYR